jgi:hypothetical protein
MLAMFGPHIDDGGCVVCVGVQYFHTMKLKADYIWSTHFINVWTKYGQPSLHGNIGTKHILHTLHHQCMDQIWTAFIVWLYRNHTYTTHTPSSMCGPNIVSLKLHCMEILNPYTHYTPSYCHTMQAVHIWSTHWWWRVYSVCVVSILPYNECWPCLVHTLMMEGV